MNQQVTERSCWLADAKKVSCALSLGCTVRDNFVPRILYVACLNVYFEKRSLQPRLISQTAKKYIGTQLLTNKNLRSTNVAAKTSFTPHNMRLIFMNPKTFRIIIIIIIIKSLFILIKNRSANQRIGWYKPVISINIIENIIIIIFILECVRNI